MPNKRDQLESDFLTLIRRGMSLHEAAAAVGVHRSTGQRWLKRIASAERPPQRRAARPRHWWESEHPRERAVLGAMRARLAELHPTYGDDPRGVLIAAASDDPLLAELRDDLLRIQPQTRPSRA